MKKYIFISILAFLFMVPSVNALCGKKDMIRIKEVANDITIKAQYSKNENGKDTGKYNLIISGLTNELYIIEKNTQKEYYYDSTNNGMITINNLESGNYSFQVYYEICDSELIKTINYKIPKYNHYANDPLCEGIQEDELDVCNRLYQGELTEEIFKEKIEEYKKNFQNVDNKLDGQNNSNNLIESLKKYMIYIIAAIILIIVVISGAVINKKRGALE